MSSALFVGITSWNSGDFLPLCIGSLRESVPEAEILVLDNFSSDGSADLVRSLGARVHQVRCSQADALNRLANASRRPFTLLLHADVVFLSRSWFAVCRRALAAGSALVSPEDIGCGPFTRRAHGAGMPESSFLLFATSCLPALRVRTWKRRWRIPFPSRQIDLFGEHVTYNLPARLRAAGLGWTAMRVHVSPSQAAPIYTPPFTPRHWSPELGRLTYGLGNFYSLDGEITHYHNWYNRRSLDVPFDSHETSEGNGDGVPLAYVRAYTERFLADYRAGNLSLPSST